MPLSMPRSDPQFGPQVEPPFAPFSPAAPLDPETAARVAGRFVSLLRIAVAVFALVCLAGATGGAPVVAAALLAVYLGFAGALHLHGGSRRELFERRLWHRVDAAWLVGAMAALGADAHLLHPTLLFPLLVAAWRWGRNEAAGLLGALGAAVLLLSFVAPGGAAPVWSAPLAAAAFLLVAALLAEGARRVGRRQDELDLLTHVGRFAEPAASVDRLLSEVLPQLRDHYGADNCLAALAFGDGPAQLHAATPGVLDLDENDLAAQLLALPPRGALQVGERTRVWVDETARDEELTALTQRVAALSPRIGAQAWISVPWATHELRGRLLVVAERRRFDVADVRLLHEVAACIAPAFRTACLLEDLMLKAAEHERRKISLDLHDSAIQPYLGLKLALEAMQRKAGPDNPLAADLEDLCWMTRECVAELRGYVSILSQRGDRHAVSLADGLRRQIERFRGFYGIEVDVNYLSDVPLNDRLTAEVLHMIGESLSNIGRHTKSRRVTINLSCRDSQFVTQIIDQGTAGNDNDWQGFTPVSLSRRAEYLGGHVEVAHQPNGGTAVLVTIPL